VLQLDQWTTLPAFAFTNGPDLKMATEELDLVLMNLVTGIDSKRRLEDVGGVRLSDFPDMRKRVYEPYQNV
jgi:hypothetical protein